MIVAGLILLAIGIADLVRQYLGARARWVGYIVAAFALFAVAVAVDAAVWGFAGIAAAALWVGTTPSDGRGRGGLWPAGVVGVGVAAMVVLLGPRSSSVAFDDLWSLPGPAVPVPIDLVVLVAGILAFLLESANIVVRIALSSEHVRGVDGEARAGLSLTPTLRGGRLIGPLERVLVFALTLAGAYTLIAAVLAAKGIVRFPEISRDSEDGNRAEYFLIGSLVSWVLAFAAAFLVWWGARS